MRRQLVLLIGLAAAAGSVEAQEALVLSGGGSRGLAHVGVLVGLEEAGHDPDIVVGTSMGAVVGALYAAGYTPEEIRERVLAVNWAEVFTATPQVIGPDREARYPMIGFDLDTDEMRFARGLIAQWRINRVLARLLFEANARARGDFDRLARRYRAVAADLRTGDAVVLADGDLARAARASMAVPGIFAPVRWDGRILVDGGIANNLPTDVARALGATTVIAADASRPPEEIHDQSPIGVFQRALDLMQENTHDDLPADQLVLPDLDPAVTGTTFPDDPTSLFEAGLTAARRDLSVLPASGEPAPERPLPSAPETFARLIVEAPDSSLAALGRHIFGEVAPGPYDPAAVLRAVDLLYTTGLFEAVWPRVVEDPVTGAPALLVRLDAPPGVSVSAAAGYENDRGGRGWASISRYTSVMRRPAVLTGSVATTGVERWAAASLRVYPRNRPALTWSLAAHARERDIRVFDADLAGDRDALRLGGSLGLELPHVLEDRLATLSAVGEWVRIQDGQRGASYGPVLRLTGLNPDVLVVGQPFVAEAEHRWGEVSYTRAALGGSWRPSLGELRLAAVADLRWSSAAAPEDVQPALGDGHAVPGLQWGEERGLTRVVAGADAAYPIRSFFARLRLRSGGVADDVEALGLARWVTGGEIAAVWRFPIGNAEIGYSVNTRGDSRTDVRLGREF
jgi:predicted acylesterase/phospholipase RssA